jgi:EpsD family peptidyl-prolyl cis-trans isomerase
MTSVRIAALALAGTGILALAACGNSGKLPDGQVVATVNGKDVTIHELNTEIGLIPNQGDDSLRKLVESVALARVIERKMLVQEATKRKLDQNPQFLLAKQRINETLLVQALQGDVQQKVTATPRENAQKFVAQNPQVFADRKIFTLDQIQFLRPANIDELPLKEAKTMGDVEKILVGANIEYRRAPQQLDSLTVNPELTTEIVRLSSMVNPEPFMFADQPEGAPAPIIFINSVTNAKTQPFIGERAITYAQNILQRQEIQKRLGTELKAWTEAYKSKIVYAKGYGPPVFPKTPAAPKAAAVKAVAAPAAVTTRGPVAAK